METTMMYPAAYCVMTEEEMTYTEGGANLLQAVCAVAVPVYGWFAGVSAIRDYRKAHPTNWTSTGIDAWNKYMDKSLPNTIYGAGCAFWTASSCFTGVGLLVNALIILS